MNVLSTYYVYTPWGTPVAVSKRWEYLTIAEKIAIDTYVVNTYPGTTVVRIATTNYSCHSLKRTGGLTVNAYVQTKWGSNGLIKNYYSNCPYYVGSSNSIGFWHK